MVLSSVLQDAGSSEEARPRGGYSVNGERVKLSKVVRAGDTVEVTIRTARRTVAVVEVAERRGPASVAATMFADTPESRAARRAPSAGSPARSEPTSARARRSRRGAGSTLCAAHGGTGALSSADQSALKVQPAALCIPGENQPEGPRDGAPHKSGGTSAWGRRASRARLARRPLRGHRGHSVIHEVCRTASWVRIATSLRRSGCRRGAWVSCRWSRRRGARRAEHDREDLQPQLVDQVVL